MKQSGATTSRSVDQANRWLILATLVVAGIAFVGAPVLALLWRTRPFPGFVVEQTLLVADYSGKGWSQALAGRSDLERVIRVGDSRVDTLKEFDAALATLTVGQETVVQTVSRDGTVRVYPSIRMIRFPIADWMRLFWLPYGVGLVYLGIGLWVYRVRGNTEPGRAFAFFCASTAIATALVFDLSTTHVASELWTTAMSFEGAALISLALVFPQESSLARRTAWARFLPYVPSLVLAGWGLLVLRDNTDPWGYVAAWRASYTYTALGIMVLVGMTVYRLFAAPEVVVRQQARVILVGSLLAFAPLGVWLGAPMFGVLIPFHTALFMPFLLIFPLSIALAILRYRLWDMDLIINRTLVYGVLVTILAAVYYVAVVALQGLFQTMSGQSSPLAVAVSTLGIAVLFNPVRRRVQDLVDRRFYRSKYDAARALSAFGESSRDEVDLSRLVQRMEDVVRETLQPAQVSLWLYAPQTEPARATFRPFTPGETAGEQPEDDIQLSDLALERLRTDPGVMQLSKAGLDQSSTRALKGAGTEWLVPLVCRNELVGWLGLGERLSGQAYSLDDRALLRDLATQAGPAIRVAQLVLERQEEARESERLAYELRFAAQVQQTLLPKDMPKLPGWQIAVHWQPARAVGGDFYDVLPLPDGRVALVIADVVDKGIPAALVMATTRSILRGTAKRLLSPSEALAQANEILHPELPQSMFVTCLYALLDPATGRLQYANAGHNLPYRRHDGKLGELRAKGMALGAMPGTRYEDHETTIAAGETILLYSDGLVEAHRPDGEMFGSERLRASVLEQAASETPLIEYLLGKLADFTGSGWEQEDDITLLTVQRHEAGQNT